MDRESELLVSEPGQKLRLKEVIRLHREATNLIAQAEDLLAPAEAKLICCRDLMRTLKAEIEQ